MKNLVIPAKSKNEITISEICSDFNGLVIGYKGDKPIGYIQFYSNSWYFLTSIDSEDTNFEYYNASLISLINVLVEDNKCTNFKVIEFFNESR